MREIMFRGKSTDNDEWVFGLYVKSVNDRAYIIVYATEDAVNTRNEIDFLYIEITPDTVGQFTGLNDCKRTEEYPNGQPIYEGDVVRLYDRYLDESWKAVIVFGNYNSLYSWGWQLKPISKTSFNIDILLWVDTEDGTATCEVIGNIYENPELTEG